MYSKLYCWVVGFCLAFIAIGSVWALGNPGSALGRLDFRQVVRDAKEKVFPAVVFIKCLRESNESGKKISEEVSGSGVLVSSDGEVVTNWHVVDKAVEVRCLLYDGRAYDAKILGSDKDVDLALLKLQRSAEDNLPLPFAVFGDSEILKEGDFVMAMGAPWGMSRSVSIGIISCTRRYLPNAGEYSLWLQTDASISPGNSGGPLVNTNGEIIGINARGMFFGGDLGFAVPATTVQNVIQQLREHGSMNWSWTGLLLQPIRDFNRNMYFDAAEGVIVAGTEPDSPARSAGIQPKDRIIRIAGQPVTGMTEEDLPMIRRMLGLLPKDQLAKIEMVRGDKSISIELTPREKGKVEGDERACPRWDLSVKTINQFDNPDLYFSQKEGVYIFGVKSPGNAQNAGLQSQDIIQKIDGRDVKTLDDIQSIHAQSLEDISTRHRLLFTVLRNGLQRQVVLDISRDYEKE